MDDEMFFTTDAASLRRGKRRASRTETCRPCLLWPANNPEMAFQGVAINVSPYGMLVRMLDALPAGTSIMVQLMRDDEFSEPMAAPLKGLVVRNESADDTFYDHGIQLIRPEIPRAEPKPAGPVRRRVGLRPRPRPRMHTLDITVGGRGSRRSR